MYIHETTEISLQSFINLFAIVINASVICGFVLQKCTYP